jgi:hypothetical protein
VGNFMHRLAGVAKVLSVSRERLRDRKTSALSLTERERDGIMKSAVSEVSTSSNVVPRPDRIGVERKQPLRPMPITAYCALVLILVCSEEHSVMRKVRLGRINAVKRCEHNIADAD